MVKRRLVVGSANASSQGFGADGRGHAETYVIFKLTGEDVRSAAGYFGRLFESADGGHVPGVWIGGSGPACAWLPSLRRTSVRLVSFGAWLRRGRLCHRYEREQTFGRLLLSLKKPLPPGPLDRAFGAAGLALQGNSTVLGAPYVTSTAEPGAGSEPRWRGSYFVETAYGHWTSEECFGALRETFVGQGHRERQSVLGRIAGMNADQEAEYAEGFLQRLRLAAEAVRVAGESPAEYFDYRDGAISESSYRARALKKLQHDRQQTKDQAFADRFVAGYTFPPVPQLDNDFFDFACSFCESIQLKAARPRNRNKIARVLHRALERETLGELAAARLPDDLFRLIERVWPVVEGEMRSFHATADEGALLAAADEIED